MPELKKKVRYMLEWKINNENGDCTARVKRSVFNALLTAPIKETKFQMHVSKNVLRLFPFPGQDIFVMPPKDEYEKLTACAKAFYAGVNKHEETFFWEFEEDISTEPTASVEVVEPIAKRKKERRKKKKKAGEIWQTTT